MLLTKYQERQHESCGCALGNTPFERLLRGIANQSVAGIYVEDWSGE